MSNGIFLLQNNGNLVEMTQQQYDSEDLLQEMLEKHPNLLAGSQIDEINPRRWVIISREFSIPDSESSGGRWSVDHLFLDQDGIPTLVEVKRSSDSRIRRELVGQMLDYAANAVTYWTVDRIQSHFEANCERNAVDPQQELSDRLHIDGEYDQYWQDVRMNLQAGKVRMLFVADEIPFELKRIVEFLNEQMNPAEVLAVEIKQFVGQDHKTLVPRVIGQLSKVQRQKSGYAEQGARWDESSFMSKVEGSYGADSAHVAKSLLDWAIENGLRIWWGRGRHSGSCVPILEHKNTTHFLFTLWTYGAVEMQLQYMTNKPVFDAIEKRKHLLDELNRIPGVNIPMERIDKRPSIPYPILKDASSLSQFLAIWNDYISQIKAEA